MKKRNELILGLVCAIAGFIISGCVSSGGTDVDTALIEGTVNMDGNTVSGARVYIMDGEYNPVLGDTVNPPQQTLSDEVGMFQFQVETGAYCVEVRHPSGAALGWKDAVLAKHGEKITLQFELKQPHTVVLPVPDNMKQENFYIYVPGSNIFSLYHKQADSSRIVLDSVPEAKIDRVLMGNMDNREAPPHMFYQDIPMFQQDTLVMPGPG